MSTPEHGPDEDQVRDLLAQFGDSLTTDAGDAIPAEVDDRIMSALAELPPLSPSTDEDGHVVPLRRPRRRVGGWLVAAALVVVVGGGGWALVQQSDSHGSADVASAGGSANDSRTSVSPLSPLSPLSKGGRAALPRVSLATFDTDVRALVGAGFAAAPVEGLKGLSAEKDSTRSKRSPAGGDATKRTQDSHASTSAELGGVLPDCRRPSGMAGRQIEVAIDGRLGQLIVTAAQGKQVVTAYDCSGDKQLATTTLR